MLMQLLMILELQNPKISGQMHQLWLQRRESHFYLLEADLNTQEVPIGLKGHILDLVISILLSLIPYILDVLPNL